MLTTDLIRSLNKLKKRNPDAPVFFITDITEDGILPLENIGMCYAKDEEIQNNSIKENSCIKQPEDGYSAIIVVG